LLYQGAWGVCVPGAPEEAGGLRWIVAWMLSSVLLAGGRGEEGDPAPPKAFEITASRFQFEPAVLDVTEGDRVVLTLRSADTTHGLSIPEFKVKATVPKGGAPVTVEFMASKAGTFPFECSEYCGAGHRQMKGRLVVAERGR
jgi:cytochrome c oxidase subunit II